MRGRGLTTNSRVLTVVVFLLLIGGVTVWFFANFERKAKEIHGRRSPVALANPLLAADRFLNRLGKPAQSHRGRDLLVQLPPSGDALVILRLTGNISPSRVTALYDWIAGGGHLIVSPLEYTDSKETKSGNPLFDRIGVLLRHHKVKDTDCGCDKEGEGDDAAGPADKGALPQTQKQTVSEQGASPSDGRAGEEDLPGPVVTLLGGHVVNLDFPRSSYLEDTRDTSVLRIGDPGNNGAGLLQFRIGKGRMTVLSSMDLFDNNELGSYDHAYLLAWLVQDNRKVWLLYSSNMDGIFTLLWRRQPRFLLALAGLLALTLWAWQYRIGPVQDQEIRGRRNVLGHIDASGGFAWRFDRARSLVAGNREVLQQRLRDRFSGRNGSVMKSNEIARKTGLKRSDIEMALFMEINNSQELVEASRCFQRLEARLTRNIEKK